MILASALVQHTPMQEFNADSTLFLPLQFPIPSCTILSEPACLLWQLSNYQLSGTDQSADNLHNIVATTDTTDTFNTFVRFKTATTETFNTTDTFDTIVSDSALACSRPNVPNPVV